MGFILNSKEESSMVIDASYFPIDVSSLFLFINFPTQLAPT